MVKGVSRRVITVKSPDPKFFEEAIFFVRDDALRSCGPDQVLREAQQIANQYLHHKGTKKTSTARFWPMLLCFLGGALLTSALFLLLPGLL